MRATSRDITQTAFTLLLGVFVIYSIYFFGTEIFKSGARISISAQAGGYGCICRDADPNADIDCGNNLKTKCFECERAFFGVCSNEQTLNVENLQIREKKIEVCYIAKESGFGKTGSVTTEVKINGAAISNKRDATDKQICIKHEFSSEISVKEVKADSGVGTNIDRLILKWGERNNFS